MTGRLTWERNKAYDARNGYLVFSIERERSGWKLYRYTTRMDGTTEFKSKEGVRSLRDGKSYAEGLAKLWGK